MAKNRKRTNAKHGNRPALMPVSAKAFLSPSYQAPECTAEPLVSLDDDWKFGFFVPDGEACGLNLGMVEFFFAGLEDNGPEGACDKCGSPGLVFGVDGKGVSLTIAIARHGAGIGPLVLCPGCLPKILPGEGRTTFHGLQLGPADDDEI